MKPSYPIEEIIYTPYIRTLKTMMERVRGYHALIFKQKGEKFIICAYDEDVARLLREKYNPSLSRWS